MSKLKKKAKVQKSKKVILKKKVKFDADNTQKINNDLAEQSFDFSTLRAFRYCISGRFCTERNLFLKRDPTNVERLIVTNVPPYISADAIKLLFSKYLIDNNSIKDVLLQRTTSRLGDLDEGYRTFSIQFDDADCVQNILKYCEDVPLVRLSDAGIHLLPCGPEKYAEEYRNNYIPVADLQERVDKFMNAYDQELLKKKLEAKRLKNVPDEDGWITVKRKPGSNLPPPGVIKSKQNPELSAKKKKRLKEDLAFYSFQVKESKMKRLEELRSKFEEDKKRIALAKAMRKFKPL